MKEIRIRNYMGAKISEIWAPDGNWREKTKADVVTFHSFDNPPGNLLEHLEKQNTLYTDLTRNEDELLSEIRKNYRYEIRRSIKDSEAGIEIYSPSDLRKNDAIVGEFREFHHEMYRAKGIDVTLTDLEVYPFINADALWITRAVKDNGTLVFHTYLDLGDTIRLYQSCSLFRDRKEDAAVIGRSNKRLHWEDMLFFRRKGFATYDWGGISSFENPNGIDEFKLSFTDSVERDRHIYYNGQIPVTLKGRIMLRAYRIFRP